LNNLAYIYADLLNQPQKALPFAEKAGELRPKDPSVLDTCGWVNFLVGNVDKAKEHLRASIKLDEKSAATQVHYAHVLFKSGDKAGAIDHLKQAGELKPDPETQAKIQKLQQEINNAT
jgi:tetratricopeptide (TPR) repeat protein